MSRECELQQTQITAKHIVNQSRLFISFDLSMHLTNKVITTYYDIFLCCFVQVLMKENETHRAKSKRTYLVCAYVRFNSLESEKKTHAHER